MFHNLWLKNFTRFQFLHSYKSIRSNQRITNIKRYFSQLGKVLKKQDLRESNSKIVTNGRFYYAEELTTPNISEDFVISEKLFI